MTEPVPYASVFHTGFSVEMVSKFQQIQEPMQNLNIQHPQTLLLGRAPLNKEECMQ